MQRRHLLTCIFLIAALALPVTSWARTSPQRPHPNGCESPQVETSDDFLGYHYSSVCTSEGYVETDGRIWDVRLPSVAVDAADGGYVAVTPAESEPVNCADSGDWNGESHGCSVPPGSPPPTPVPT